MISQLILHKIYGKDTVKKKLTEAIVGIGALIIMGFLAFIFCLFFVAPKQVFDLQRQTEIELRSQLAGALMKSKPDLKTEVRSMLKSFSQALVTRADFGEREIWMHLSPSSVNKLDEFTIAHPELTNYIRFNTTNLDYLKSIADDAVFPGNGQYYQYVFYPTPLLRISNP